MLTLLLLGCGTEPVAPPPAEEAFAARQRVEIRAELKRDAPVVATLELGERVEILGRRRRFVRVRTKGGVEGWTRDTRLATAELRAFMAQLQEQTRDDPSQGTFRALGPLNIHLEPYRWSPTIYQLQEDEAAELLRHRLVDRLPSRPEEGKPLPSPTDLDDWYLVRLSNERVGWALASGLYAAIPDEVKQFAERKRITSYSSLGKVDDEARGVSKDTWLWTQIERSNLPYDFDRFRVFMWSRSRGSYQTIRLIAGLTGHLPIQTHDRLKTKYGIGPGFTIIVEDDGERVARTFVLVQHRLFRVGDEPAPPPPAPLRFVKEEPPATPPPTLMERVLRWWDSARNSGPGSAPGFYPLDKEIALGRELAREIQQNSEILEDALVSEFVRRLGERLAGQAGAQAPITINVVVDSTPTAAAFPGGFLFLSSGLIGETDSEAELAAVLAHEIAHVAARHGTHQATPGEVARFAAIPLIFVGPASGSCLRLARESTLPVAARSMARDHEEEADSLALGYLHAMNYDPTALADIFERLPYNRETEPDLTVHDRMETFLAGLPAKPEYLVGTEEFNRVRRHLSRLLPPEREPRTPTLLGPN